MNKDLQIFPYKRKTLIQMNAFHALLAGARLKY